MGVQEAQWYILTSLFVLRYVLEMDNKFKKIDELTDDEDFFGAKIDYVLYPKVQTTEHELVQAVYRNRPDHFDSWNDQEFPARFRLGKNIVRFVAEEIFADISSAADRNHAATPSHGLHSTTRFLAMGSFLQVAGDFGVIHNSRASRIIYKVLRAIAGLNRDFIEIP